MKTLKTIGLSAILLSSAASAYAEDVKIGVILGFTGPVETLAPPVADAAEWALAEANASGKFLNGSTLVPVRGDSTCVDAAAAVSAAERLVGEGIKGIMGAACSGVTGAILANVAVPNGIVQISPSATSPALSSAPDNGLFFRTVPSDARQGEVMAAMLIEKGIKSVAVTYTNNDYGKGLSDSFEAAYKNAGGTVTLNAGHSDGKADYAAEVGALAAAGGELLVVIGYLDQGGAGMIQASLDAGAFERFHLADGMIGSSLTDKFGASLDGSFGQHPGSDSAGGKLLTEQVGTAFNISSPYAMEGYDAAALIVLAMQAAGSADPTKYKEKVFEVANAPGTPILPGEIGKALEILASGGDVDFVGATNIEFIGAGEAAGSYRVVDIKGGQFETAGYR